MKLSSLKGIGQKTEQLFTKAGITDTSQLPYYYPRSYDIYKEPVLISEIDEDGIYTLYLSIASDVEVKPMKKLNITTVFAVDEQNERIKLTWFNMPFIKAALRRGYRYMVRGRVVCRGSLVSMEQPKLYTAAEYEQKLHYIQPIYQFAEKIKHFHIKDVHFFREKFNQVGFMAPPLAYIAPKLPGLGDVNWGAVVSALNDIGYRGDICIEVEDRAYENTLEDRLDAIRLSTRYMEQFVI